MRIVGLLAAASVLALGLAQAHTLLAASTVPRPLAPVANAAPTESAPIPAAGPPPGPPPAPSVSAPRTQALKRLLDQTLSRPPLAGAQIGVQVVSVDTGEVLYARDADRLLNPASNVKLVTSGAALARLGPEYRFRTDFACAPALHSDGTCPTLWVQGHGDPSLTTERLYGVLGELAHRGLRKVGDIAVDDRWFDAATEGPGWEQEKRDRPYMAPSAALSVNHNAVAIYVSNEGGEGPRDKGRVRIDLEPASDYFIVENKVSAAPRRARMRLVPSSIGAGDRQRIRVSGRMPAGRATQVFYRKVDNPALYAGETVKALLAARGVPVRGRVLRGAMPASVQPLYTTKSPALAEVVRELNKISSNFDAEQLLRTLGAEVSGPPGSWPKGVAAVESFLEEAGIARGSYVLKNGSGLNDTNRFSAAQLARLLVHVARRTTYYPELASSLGIAGRDGTLRLRLDGTAAEGRLRGKTGTLDNVSSLSGYVKLETGETWAYAIVANGAAARRRRLVGGVDQLAAHVASGGLGPADALPDQLASPAAVMEGLVKWAALGSDGPRQGRGEELAQLRRQLRRERDPVLRAAMADALYRSEADGAASLLMEQVPSDAAAFARLASSSLAAKVVVPTLSPLLDLAAAGDDEALDKALALSGFPLEDPPSLRTLAEGLDEAGRNAPDELFEAFKRASDATRTPAFARLAAGIVAAGDDAGHPFVERLATLRKDQTNTVVLALHDQLQRALAEARRTK